WKSHLAVLVLTAAAAVALTILIDPGQWFRSKPQTPPVAARGWSKPEAFQDESSPAEYLRKIAKNAEEYRSGGPESADALSAGIGEFRVGCTRLLLAEHGRLSAEVRDDLRRRCRNWADKLDRQRLELEKDPARAKEIAGEVDQLVNQLTKTLREKA